MFSFHMMDISAKKFKDQEIHQMFLINFWYYWQYINAVLMAYAHLILTSSVLYDDT